MTALAELVSGQGRNRRRSERFALDRPMTITLSAADRDHLCCLEDISYGGLRVRIDGEIARGEPVVVEHSFVGRLHGTPVWQRGAAMGIELQVREGELQHALQCVGLLLSSDDDGRGRDQSSAEAGSV